MTEACFMLFGNTVQHIFTWIEGHPVLIGIATTVFLGSFGFRKFIKQKRAEAFFGFYARLLLQLKSLQSWLDEKELLNTDEDKSLLGNIYALMYNPAALDEACPGFRDLNESELNDLKGLVLQLRKTLIESENNVYPKHSSKELWYESQQVLYLFCDFIEQDGLRKKESKYKYDKGINEGKFKHMVKCDELKTAIHTIQSFISKEKY